MSDAMSKITEGFAQMQVIAEAAVGYHKKLIDGGISADTADELTKEWHTAMMEVMKRVGANMTAGRR